MRVCTIDGRRPSSADDIDRVDVAVAGDAALEGGSGISTTLSWSWPKPE